LREQLSAWRKQGRSIALAPTMGNLHAGHLSLVKKAQQIADRTVATIFVNPVQFVQREDYAAYPRTLEDDRKALEASGADVLFHPEVNEMYPEGAEMQTRVTVTGLDDIFCGKFRPGHFSGVATAVTKLFHITEPDVALFGEKGREALLSSTRAVPAKLLAAEFRFSWAPLEDALRRCLGAEPRGKAL